jgi:hypothetical protein
MNCDPRYAGVATALPAVLPPITKPEALNAYARLVRAFGGVASIPVGVLEQRGGRAITTKRTRGRQVWAATKPTTGHHKGWGRLIHDAAHYVFEKRHPSARPHDGGHATLEREMAEYVAKRADTWLAGALKPASQRPTVRPSTGERRATALLRAREGIARWEAKARRADRALRKLRARERRLLKTVN